MKRLWLLAVGALYTLLFVVFQARGIVTGDSGDLVTAAYLFGVPHPPGYPLYTLLGWLASQAPLFTVAWRVGLLSSVPHVVVGALIFVLVYKVSKSITAAVFASLVLLGNYLFFFYSITPEVFALLDMFVALLIYLIYQFRQTQNIRYLYGAALIFGLSLGHHHMIIFLVPAMVFWFLRDPKLYRQNKKTIRWIPLICLVILGLCVYGYVPLAAHGTAIVNWDRVTTPARFIQLVTRADYGTFVSGGFYGAYLIQRFLQLKAYGQFLVMDIRWFGIALAALGAWWLYRKDRYFGLFLLCAIVSMGPFFFFYASFPLINRFTLGTYERFLLPSYILIAPLIAFGLVALTDSIRRFLEHRHARTVIPVGVIGVVIIVFLYAGSQAAITLYTCWGMATDQTSENLARDILASVPPQTILLIHKDTSLFTTQYVRYVLGVRPDVVVLHGSRLYAADYPQIVARRFPALTIPTSSGPAFYTDFIAANRSKYPIYTNLPVQTEKGWLWVQYGLVYRLTEESETTSPDEVFTANDTLWEKYHDPTVGILSRFNHLMLADIRDVYASARIEFGRALLKANKVKHAKEQFNEAIRLGGDVELPDAYTYVGLSELFEKNCEAALSAFSKAKETSLIADKLLTLYEGITYRDCAKDATRAGELMNEYEQLRKKQETSIQ